MRRALLLTQLLLLFILSFSAAFGQGEVGIGTTTPQEKLDVNGALIIRSEATSPTPATGTIQYNTTVGWHEGWLGSGEWRKEENDYDYVSGTYASTGCGAALSTSVGTYVTTATTESPFYKTTADKKIQYLIKASELTTAGFCAGNITSVGFIVTTLGAASYSEYAIGMKNTSTTSLTTSWETGVTSVYGPSSITVVLGNNDFTLTTPFYWDGTSNLVIEICYNNTTTGLSSFVQIDNSGGYNKTTYKTGTSLTPCVSFTSPVTSVNRPVIRLTGLTYGTYLTANNYYYFSKGIILGSPVIPSPYEHHGPGTITGEAIYDDNTQLSDYIFDAYFDGTLNEEDATAHAGYQLLSIDEMIRYIIDNRHLPTIYGRSEWNASGTFSTGTLSTQLWATSETQILYLLELNQRLETLQQDLNKLITDQ